MSDFLWSLANVLLVAHLVIVVPLLILAIPLFGAKWGWAFLGTVIGLQACFLNCPMSVLETWLRRLARPDYSDAYDPFMITKAVYSWLGPFGPLHWILAAAFFGLALYALARFPLHKGKWRPRTGWVK